MKEITGNIWDFHKQGHWIVITTNGTVKSNGEAVMGRGVALQAKMKFTDLPKRLGDYILKRGNKVGVFPDYKIVTLPVKHHWRDQANLKLIESGIIALSILGEWCFTFDGKVYMVRPGCGNGQLDWKDVKPILEEHLDDRFIIVERV